METETHIWDALPDDLLRSILARLPVRDVARMRIVCKRWKYLLPPGDALRRIDPNFSVNSIPAFLIQLYPRHEEETWIIELGHGGGWDINIYKCPFPSERIVVDGCQSICLYMRKGDRLDLSLCNPATRTSRQLPRPPHNDPNWYFSAMTLDATLRRCTVLLGQNNVEDRTGNLMALQIYDSESNAWTRVSMKVPFLIQPRNNGFYSNGKFYWIIVRNVIYSMVAIDTAESSWKEIRLPEACRGIFPFVHGCLFLSGYDGRVVLILQGKKRGSIRMWRLNDGGDVAEWHELHTCIPECHKFYLVAVKSEWIMLVDSEMEVYLCNLERKSTQKILLPGRLPRELSYFQWFLSAFESNNVWWP